MKKSFRDPSGFVILENDKAYRAIQKSSAVVYEKLLQEDWYRQLVLEKKIQKSTWVNNSNLSTDYLWLEHEKFDFPLFAHQISAQQLFQSAKLTIEIAQKAYAHGWVLKDASVWNVIFLYGHSQFIDITSFEPYDGQSSLWIAYGQFCRHYIIPLLLFKHLGISAAKLFTLNRDGISSSRAKKLLGFHSYTSMAAIETVLLPSKLNEQSKLNKLNAASQENSRLNKTIFLNTLNRLNKYIDALEPSNFIGKSVWSDYEQQRQHYSVKDLVKKSNFVKKALEKISGSVLDLGCNQGEYSLLAASLGLKVVASDFDDYALVKMQSQLNGQSINVMHLNLAQPTPAIGWRNEEHDSFINQSKNYFEIVLCLGLIHHLLVTERIPLDQILDLLGSMSQRYILVEWVNPDDKMFSEIASVNAHLYSEMSEAYFENEVRKHFTILDSLGLDQAQRRLYLLEKKYS